ncbi:unnamed protein product [Polarella glacialis]|uniref:Uncharacterized protein n=1 Tax=Polarella glacialis TaxID=89957 RepID=A0A813KV94_POLGL|nr:unnamed protein product [Polarella glacialis]
MTAAPITIQKHFWYFFRNVLLRSHGRDAKDGDIIGSEVSDRLVMARGEKVLLCLVGSEQHRFYTFMCQPYLCSPKQFRELLRLMTHALGLGPEAAAADTRPEFSSSKEQPVLLSLAEIRQLGSSLPPGPLEDEQAEVETQESQALSYDLWAAD